MNKKIFENFINKYNLSRQVDSVTWKSTDAGLSVAFASEDRSLTGFVSTNVLDFPIGEYDIYDTGALKSFIAILGDDFTVDVEKNDVGDPIAFRLNDGVTKIKFVLADRDITPAVPSPKGFPPFEITLTLDQQFITTFSRATGALKESETFTVLSDGSHAKIVLGHSQDTNQNSVSIDVETSENGILAPVNFMAGYFRDVLQANKELTGGFMRVSSLGLAEIKFTLPDFKATYYLTKVNI